MGIVIFVVPFGIVLICAYAACACLIKTEADYNTLKQEHELLLQKLQEMEQIKEENQRLAKWKDCLQVDERANSIMQDAQMKAAQIIESAKNKANLEAEQIVLEAENKRAEMLLSMQKSADDLEFKISTLSP